MQTEMYCKECDEVTEFDLEDEYKHPLKPAIYVWECKSCGNHELEYVD